MGKSNEKKQEEEEKFTLYTPLIVPKTETQEWTTERAFARRDFSYNYKLKSRSLSKKEWRS